MLVLLAVAIDLRLALSSRPLLGVDGDAGCVRVQFALFDPLGDVADVVVIGVRRGLARAGVLAAKLVMLRVGEPPVHRPAVGIAFILAD